MFGSGGADVRFPVTDLEPAFTDLSEADLNSYVKLKHLWDGTAIPALARLNRSEEGHAVTRAGNGCSSYNVSQHVAV